MPAFESLGSYVPVTSLRYLSTDLLLAGIGSDLIAYNPLNGKELATWRLLCKDRIHHILAQEVSAGGYEIVVCGGQEAVSCALTVRHDRTQLDRLASTRLSAWILSTAFLRIGQSTEVLLVTAHNVFVRAAWPQLGMITSTPCSEQPLLWSAAFDRDKYSSIDSVSVCCGTVMQEVLVWQPCTASSIQLRYTGHNVGESLHKL